MNDQPERREGVKAMLRQIHRQARMSDVTDWRQLDRLLERGLPDLLVIDWRTPDMSVDRVRVVRDAHAQLAIAILTDDADPATVIPLVRAGALGVIPRELEPRLIVRALELVLLGGYYVPVGALGPDMSPCPVPQTGAPPGRPLSHSERAERAATLAGCRSSARNAARAGLLSPRQQQIMRLVHLGNTNKSIARALDISEGTVKIHLAAVFRLLGAANRAAAVALYNGWQHGALQSIYVDSPVPEAEPRRGMRSPVPLRLSTQRAVYDGQALAGHRGERSPPYLIAAQPEWPFAPPRRRASEHAIEPADPNPPARGFETREGATPRRIPRGGAESHAPGTASGPPDGTEPACTTPASDTVDQAHEPVAHERSERSCAGRGGREGRACRVDSENRVVEVDDAPDGSAGAATRDAAADPPRDDPMGEP